ncbi:MAG: RNA polymerase factor sigma-54 [Phycisphaerae bacterium]|nr:RNA polymerase factor sigma-54 [Phycisphaerae bacterium]
MSQYLSQVAAQVLRQEQRLTPQLIQSMEFLQLPLLAFEQRLQQEMESNPALEVEQLTPEVSLDDQGEAPAETDAAAGDDGFDRLDELTREYDFDDGDRAFMGASRSDGERDAKMDAMASTASRPICLQEYLLQQWALVDESPDVKRAGELIINQIDEDGYLRTSLEEITRSVSPPLTLDLVEYALVAAQDLEPTGVAARNLKECLLLQLDVLPGHYDLEERIIRHHLEDIEKNRYPAVAKALGCEIAEVKEAVETIAHLNPRPGMLITEHEVPRITPDVIVDYDDEGRDGYTVRLARGNTPRLRISPSMRRLLEASKQDKEVREFLRKNIEAASAIIDAVQYRQQRLLEVAKIVVDRQREFLDNGPSGLKILRMNDLARELNCDPSTISRTVADKYMQTPRGIYPVRMFFTGGTETASGESTSWDSVKAHVKEVIANEDKSDPLSDEAIAAVIQKEGVDISRRTIAKYRSQLNIPAARQRRAY